jgi:flagellin-like hook-associated protein FlgL
MTITPLRLGTFTVSSATDLLLKSRAQMDDLQRQLSTGKKSLTYGGLGVQRITSLDMRAKLAEVEGYQDTITRFNYRSQQLNLHLDRVRSISNEAATATGTATPQYDPDATGKTSMQRHLRTRFDEAVDLLNLQVNGDYYFAGRKTDTKPVLDPQTILYGDSAGRAGVSQLITERKAADYGVAASAGRVTRGGAGATASLTEDGAHPFGIKLTAASSTSAGTTAVRTAGPPADVTFTVTANPAAGDEIRLQLTMPDLSTKDIVLTARIGPTTPAGDAGGFDIGATPAATAANVRTALAAMMDREATITLPPASAMAASKAFFNGTPSAPPLRVVGPPATATTLAAGTAANTVIWYQGDDTSADPRFTVQAKVDASISVGLGVQANEDGIKRVLSNLAAFVSETFNPAVATDKGRYEQLAQSMRAGLGQRDGVQRVESIQAEIAMAANLMKSTGERHKAKTSFVTSVISDVEDVSNEETAAKLLSLQTKMQAAYQTTAIISRLSLTDYLR